MNFKFDIRETKKYTAKSSIAVLPLSVDRDVESQKDFKQLSLLLSDRTWRPTVNVKEYERDGLGIWKGYKLVFNPPIATWLALMKQFGLAPERYALFEIPCVVGETRKILVVIVLGLLEGERSGWRDKLLVKCSLKHAKAVMLWKEEDGSLGELDPEAWSQDWNDCDRARLFHTLDEIMYIISFSCAKDCGRNKFTQVTEDYRKLVETIEVTEVEGMWLDVYMIRTLKAEYAMTKKYIDMREECEEAGLEHCEALDKHCWEQAELSLDEEDKKILHGDGDEKRLSMLKLSM